MITYEVFNRIIQEMAVWGSNVEDDADAQWISMGIDPQLVNDFGDFMKETTDDLYPDDPELGFARCMAYVLAVGIRIGREQERAGD